MKYDGNVSDILSVSFQMHRLLGFCRVRLYWTLLGFFQTRISRFFGAFYLILFFLDKYDVCHAQGRSQLP